MKLFIKIKSKSFLSTLLIVSTVLLGSQSIAADYPEKGDFQKGAQAWADNCVRCHNMRDPKDLRDDQWITSVFHMRVRAGLTGQKTRDILTFLQGSNNPGRPVKTEMGGSGNTTQSKLSGEEVYQQTCVACHGPDGKGTVPGAPDLTDSDGVLSQSDEILTQHISEGFKSKNSPMAMPAMGGNPDLNETDVRNVVKHMKSKFNQ